MKKLLYNARIRLSASDADHADALLIDCGRIAAAGRLDDLEGLCDPATKRENLAGKTVWPGLCDAHLHLQHYALALDKIDCAVNDRREVIRRVRSRAETQPPGTWILGHGWNQDEWPDGFGSASELDQAAPEHPVYLTAHSLHAGWANSLALRKAGISRDTPDPAGGQILRDAQGNPNGILLETADTLVSRGIPEPSDGELQQLLMKAQTALLRLGLTAIHDFDRIPCFHALQALDVEEKLILRVTKSLPVEALPFAISAGLRSGWGSDHLRIGSIKLFADGALGPRTAAMLEPYSDDPSERGILLMDAEDIYEIGQQAAGSGLSLTIHAIGDHANHEALEAYTQLRSFESRQGLPSLRHRIEHVQCLHPADLPRLAELNIIASVQPVHATTDMHTAERFWGSRVEHAYAYASLLASGVKIACGSDAPVESPNPFHGLLAAVARQRLDGSPSPEGWRPAQKLSLQQALAGFTTGAAWAGGWETSLGTLRPGHFADLILLDEDPFSLPQSELGRILPSGVMASGEWVWRD